jgi:hypothetical protein
LWIGSLLAVTALAGRGSAQRALPDAPGEYGAADKATAPGEIHGVVVSPQGDVYEGVHIRLSASGTARETTSDGDGRFRFADVPPGPFTLTLSTGGFDEKEITGQLKAGDSFDAKQIVILLSTTSNDVRVSASRVEIAQEQMKDEEQQRVLGVIPNFYVVYAPDAPPLNSKQKFSLAWRSSIDWTAFAGAVVFAGVEQADNSFSGYGQGVQGYAKRLGANYADGFISTMVGGAILPSLLKQDPRYFYKGTGTKRSRFWYAIANAVVCKGDNGHWQVNYSGIGGSLASGGISNIYYPAANRDGVGLTFEDTGIGIGASAIQNLFQEFLVRRLTPHAPNYASPKP